MLLLLRLPLRYDSLHHPASIVCDNHLLHPSLWIPPAPDSTLLIQNTPLDVVLVPNSKYAARCRCCNINLLSDLQERGETACKWPVTRGNENISHFCSYFKKEKNLKKYQSSYQSLPMIWVKISRYSEEMCRSPGFNCWQPETDFLETPSQYEGVLPTPSLGLCLASIELLPLHKLLP